MNQVVQTETGFVTTDSRERAGTISEETALPALLVPALKALQADSRRTQPVEQTDDSLFEQFAWLYAFFRERIFRDDTGRIIQALWPEGKPEESASLLELGCGPGFYACGLAEKFPQISVLGVDRSARQLAWAEKKASKLQLENCSFESEDVLDLSHPDETFDALVAARLFTILPDQTRAVAEMYRVLRPGGRCLIAEPRYAFWASLPLFTMWLLAGVMRMNNGYCEPRRATVLSATSFRALFTSQPWATVKTWQDGRYQYALCEKV